jgi:YD repeat-containing protein
MDILVTTEEQWLHESRRRFLKQSVVLGVGLIVSPALLARRAAAGTAGLTAAPGPAHPWQGGQSVYSGSFNPATGNAHFRGPVCGWGGTGGGLAFGLFYSSQSARSTSVGPKWSHSFSWRVMGASPATVIAGDGTETIYTLSGSSYIAPVGTYDTLVKNANGTWMLTQKMGTIVNFRSDGTLGSIVDTHGNTTTCVYTGSNLTSVVDPSGRALTLGYSGASLASVTDIEGRVWTLAYDSSGRLAQLTDPPLNGASYSRVFGYDTNSNLAAHTNRLGKTWAFAYGSGGVLSSQTDPSGNASGASAGVNHSVGVQPNTMQTNLAHAPVWPSNVVAAGGWTDPTGANVQYGYDSSGRMVAVQGATDECAVVGYDASNNKTSHQTSSGATWQWAYDGTGNALTSTDPLNLTTRMTYDSASRLLTNADPTGSQTQYAYSASGSLTTLTDPLNNVTHNAYDAYGNLTQTTDPLNRTTTHTYDAWGNRTKSADPLGNATTYQYTASRVTQRTDPLGRVTNYAYDTWGRQVGVTYPTTGNPSVALTLDAEGRLTQSMDGTGTRTYAYDPWGRKTAMTDPMGNTAATYDGAGRMLTQTDVSGRTHSYAYDSSTRLQSVGDGSGTVSYTYNADSRPATAVYPNGTQATYGYDTSGRVTSLAHTLVSTRATIISYAAQYDSAGRLTQVTEQPSGAVTTYQYDSASRLLSETRTGQSPYSGTYTYFNDGSRKTALTVTNGATTQNGTYTYDGGGRLTQVNDTVSGLETYAWNQDSTLASMPRPGYTALMGYDEEGRLTTIQHSAGGTVTPAYEYAYGADGGRRWRKDLAGDVWTWYPCGVACGAGQLVETQSDLTGDTWTTSAQYLQGRGLVQRNAEFHHPNISGVNAVITGSTGAVLSSNLYDQFGVQQATQGQAQTPYRCGQQAEEGTVQNGKSLRLPSVAASLQTSPVTTSLLSLGRTTASFTKTPLAAGPSKNPLPSNPSQTQPVSSLIPTPQFEGIPIEEPCNFLEEGICEVVCAAMGIAHGGSGKMIDCWEEVGNGFVCECEITRRSSPFSRN